MTIEKNEKVVIFDTTLRDGEQSPGASLSISEKLEIAHQLAKLGVDIIEAGFPVSSHAQFEATRLCAEQVDGPVICGLARANEKDITAAGDALIQGDMSAFGQWVDRSQRGAEELLGNQIPQTSYLAQSAREHGAVAASAFGAGFGGSVWALVEKAQAESFLEAWAASYRDQFPQDAKAASFLTTGAGPAAFQVT